MEAMTPMDWVAIVTATGMKLTLIVVPLLLAYWQKGKLEKDDIARAVVDAVAVVASTGADLNSRQKKEKALEIAARSLRKPAIKDGSLALAEGVLEGEVHRLKAGSLARMGG